MEQKKVKKGTPPPGYDETFKTGAVRLVTEQGRQPTEVAKDPGTVSHPGTGDGSAQPAQAAWREGGGGHRCTKKIREHPVETIEEKYRCVQALSRQGAAVEQVCRELSRSGYYDWLGRKPSDRSRSNQALRRRLIELHEKYPAMGLNSLYHLLKPEFGSSRKRVHRQMRIAGIVSLRRRAYKSTTKATAASNTPPGPTGNGWKHTLALFFCVKTVSPISSDCQRMKPV